MTTTQILGLNVTTTERDRFEQVRSEMLAGGHGPKSAERWAGNAIGIGAQVEKAHAARDAYAAALEAGRTPVSLVLTDA